MALQPFSPDNEYCVYCHAVAAGPCATCGAICCGDCVDLVMGLTTQRAVCHSCGEQLRTAAGAKRRRWANVGFALIVLAAIAALTWSAWPAWH